MREMRTYDGFGSHIALNQVGLAALETECARFLVNLKPEIHNWTEPSVTGPVIKGTAAASAEVRRTTASSAADYAEYL